MSQSPYVEWFLAGVTLGSYQTLQVIGKPNIAGSLNAAWLPSYSDEQLTGIRVTGGISRRYRLVSKRRFSQWFAARVGDPAPYRSAKELLHRYHARLALERL